MNGADLFLCCCQPFMVYSIMLFFNLLRLYSCRFWAASTVIGSAKSKGIVHVCALRFFCRKCGQNPRKMVCFGDKMSNKCQLSPQKNEMMVVAFCGDNGVYVRWIMGRFFQQNVVFLTSFMA